MKSGFFEYPVESRGRALEANYAVIDLETSGLSAKSHRVLEIAIVRLDANGEFLDEISTLINPGDGIVGPTHIHHISAESVKQAPTFLEFSDELKNWLSGCIVVAHNAAFEESFLESEFRKIHRRVGSIPCIDTLQVSRQVLNTPNHKLQTILEHHKINYEDIHTALGDARALSELLPKLLDQYGPVYFQSEVVHFPKTEYQGTLRTRVTNLKKGSEGWMAGVIRKLPYSGLPITNAVAIEYLDLLSNFLSDGKLTQLEVRELLRVAGESGLGSEQLQDLHRSYFDRIEAIALMDGILDAEEEAHLKRVRQALALDTSFEVKISSEKDRTFHQEDVEMLQNTTDSEGSDASQGFIDNVSEKLAVIDKQGMVLSWREMRLSLIFLTLMFISAVTWPLTAIFTWLPWLLNPFLVLLVGSAIFYVKESRKNQKKWQDRTS